MRLSQAQTETFERDGYLFFPGLFRPDEIKVLLDEVPSLYAQRRPENVREKTGDVVRTNFAAHMYSAPFARLARHPRMVDPIRHDLHISDTQIGLLSGFSVAVFYSLMGLPFGRWADKQMSNIIHWNELDRGGHFAAWEQPELYVDEVRTCFSKVR